MKKAFLLGFVLLIGTCFLFNILPTQAKNYGLGDTASKAGYPTGSSQTPANIATKAINAALSLVYIVFLVLMLYAGIRWMTAQGNEEYVTKAKNILTAAIIGLVVISAAYAITTFVLGRVSGEGEGTPLTEDDSCNFTCNNNLFAEPVCEGSTKSCCSQSAFSQCVVDEGKSIDECLSDDNVCMSASVVNGTNYIPPEDVTNCANTEKDGDESDVDCGGSCATKCSVGDNCNAHSDCTTNTCNTLTKKCDSVVAEEICCVCKNGENNVSRVISVMPDDQREIVCKMSCNTVADYIRYSEGACSQ